jgi:hypothetical protein
MSDEHVQPLLEDDDQPSWVTMAAEGDGNTTATSDSASGSSPWDQAVSRLSGTAENANPLGWGERPQEEKKDDDLPKIVLLMRLGNMGAAALLIFGSVRIRSLLSLLFRALVLT